jgi:phosphoribosylaminoimidazole-succinocarboxamide synthase
MSDSLFESNFEDLKLIKRGKVRDLYDLGDSLLLVATDRMSAFDVVLPDPIPDKGKILTKISLFWFDMMKPLIANHLISSEVDDYPAACRPYAETLRGRSMLVKKASPLTIECVARGYISGSGWKSYRESGSICGISLPSGLRESDQLPEPIFTPATKEEIGFHDINIDFEEAAKRVGRKTAERVKDLTLRIYRKGAEYAETKGIIIADTKFEFGMVNGDLIMIDEALTPDSSRFWPKAEYSPGGPQPSFDKQYLRDYLVSIKWDQNPPAPSLPGDIIRGTRGKYLEALEKLTGRSL